MEFGKNLLLMAPLPGYIFRYRQGRRSSARIVGTLSQYFEQLPSSSMRSRSRVADQPAQEANPTFSSATYGTEASATIVNRRFDEVYQLAAGRLTLVVVQDPMRSCGSLSIVRTQCGCTVSISCNGL